MTDSPTTNPNEDSLGRRYLSKLATNVVRVPLGVATQAVIPRVLGPSLYGDFNFLVSTFDSLVSFADTGTLTAFYTKLSARPNDVGLVAFYWRFVAVVSLVVLLGVGAILLLGVGETVWPDQATGFIWMGALLGLLKWYERVGLRVIDAHALTVAGEVVRMAEGALGALAIWIAYLQLGRLGLTEFFLYRYALMLFLCAGYWFVLRRRGISLVPADRMPTAEMRRYGLEIWKFASPLISYAGISFVAVFADRWLLQMFGGSVEQGYFSLANKVAAISLLFTSAMTPLLLRELSRSFADRDRDEMRRLFRDHVPLLFLLAAFVAVFFSTQASRVVWLFGGDQFQGAEFVVAVMALYPIYQTYGQLSGAVFFATGQTAVYRNIGTAVLVVGIAATFFLLAPPSVGGLGLNANGLGIKTLAVPIVGVNVQLWFCTRLLDLSFGRLLLQQVTIIGGFALIGSGVGIAVDGFAGNRILALGVAAALYGIGCLLFTLLLPGELGIDRSRFRFFTAAGR